MSAAEPNGDLPDQNIDPTAARDGDGGGSIRRWGRLGGIGAALGMSAVFAVAAWYALQRGDMQPEVAVEVPLVKAAEGPVKEKPEDPGGLKIPNQDKLVYERITPKPQTAVAEKLAPAPEEPIVKPAEEQKPADPGEKSAAKSSAPAAPKIAKPAEKAVEDAAKPDVKAAPKPKAAIATAEKHAAPPAITSTAGKTEGAKTESLLPPPDKPAKEAVKEAAPPVKAAAPAKVDKVAKEQAPAAKAVAKKVVVKETAAKKPTPAKPAAAKPAAAKPVASKPVASKPAASGYRIQFASYRKAALAKKAWQRLKKAHGDILGSLTGHTARADLGKRGVYFRSQAGFFGNAASARAACAKLKAKKQDCIIVPPKK